MSVDERRRQVRRLTRQGKTGDEIAEALGIAKRTVQRDRVTTGCDDKTSLRRLTDEEVAMAKQMLEDGCGYSEAARTINCTRSVLKRRFPGMGMSKENAKILIGTGLMKGQKTVR